MTYWFTSDTHFGHANIIRYSKRPFKDVNEMNEALIANWNAKVKADDIVWHLGDFAFLPPAQIEAILVRLNGRKHLCFGNHDKALRKEKRLLHTYFEQHCDKAVLKVQYKGGEQRIVLNHFPELTWDQGHRGAWMLHGHCHGTVLHPWGGKIQDVGVDPMNMEPVSFETLAALMDSRSVSKHHDA